MKQLNIETKKRIEMVDITADISKVVKESGILRGICFVYVPHTTAAVTINENADPDVPKDILDKLDDLVPADAKYRHREGNADAHIKSSLIGSHVAVMVENSTLVLGTWQSIFFCEFDGPRRRNVIVKLISDR
jgi:secondary thiamine-phosphate synthase enzyme